MTLLELIGSADYDRLTKAAKEAQNVENTWLAEADRLRERIAVITRSALERGEHPVIPEEMLEDFVFLNALSAWGAAIESEHASVGHIDAKKTARMARKKERQPRTMREVRALYDAFRQKRVIPARQRQVAEDLMDLYLKKIAALVGRKLQPMKEGDQLRRDAIEKTVMHVADVMFARAKTIVATETCRNFNGARRAIYDVSPDVVAYLFVALRDHATTPWCRSRQGLWFLKGTPLLEHNTPPCHWSCRSEILPLTKQSPSHRKILDDRSRDARRHRLVPLPPEWHAPGR